MGARTILVSGDPSDFHRQSGLIFLDDLRSDASRADAPDAVKRDWAVIAAWIEHTSGNLTSAQAKKLEAAWTAYLAIGLAPSAALQDIFTSCADELAGSDKRDRAPAEVMDVFDRLLATDEEIRAKRAADLARTEDQFRPLLNKFPGHRRVGWWRRQSPLARTWIFGTVVWATVVLVAALFFDPFDVGGWDRMNDEEFIRLLLIITAPAGAGAVYYIYQRWVR